MATVFSFRIRCFALQTARTRNLAALCLSFLACAILGGAHCAPLTPSISGPWIKLVGKPPLERWATEKAEPVDFTCFQAEDGTWQLIACIRHTSHPGNSRLLYRWSSEDLLAENWTPEGIFLSSREDWDNELGHLQAPFHAIENGKHHLFYNSRGAHLLTSADGLHWEPFGQSAVFQMGRDLCLLDDRADSGNWIAYYTSPEPGINPATRDHTVRARTASRLTGPWSDEAVELPPLTPPWPGYTFVYAESPLVVRKEDFYYRFEQLYVFRSVDPLRWEGPAIASLNDAMPIRLLAPEIVTLDDQDYILAYQWLNDDPRGIYLAPLSWETETTD